VEGGGIKNLDALLATDTIRSGACSHAAYVNSAERLHTKLGEKGVGGFAFSSSGIGSGHGRGGLESWGSVRGTIRPFQKKVP